MQCALASLSVVDAAGLRGHTEAFGLQCQSASGQAARDREPGLAEGRPGRHAALGCAGRPVRPGRGPVCGNGFRLGPLVRLAGPCLGAEPLVSRRDLIPIPVRAAGGLNGLVHHRLLTDRPARGAGCSSWVLRTLPWSPPASSSAADSGASYSWATIRPSPFLPWSSGLPGPAWLVRRLSCPGSGVAGAWRARGELPGRAWWTFGQKHPPGGGGPSHSPANGGNCPLKVTLLPSVDNSWQAGAVLPPGYVQRSEEPVVRTAMSAFNGPFLSASLCPGLSGCRDCSHTATKIKVDAEHPARKPDPLPRAVVVILGKCPEESRSNAPFPAATAG